MRVLDRTEAARVAGGDNPAMGPYVPPITHDMSNRVADLSFNSLSSIGMVGLGYMAVLTGSKVVLTGLAASSPTALGELKTDMENYTWGQLQQQNVNNGYDKDGEHYLWPSGVAQPFKTSDADQSNFDTQVANGVVAEAKADIADGAAPSTQTVALAYDGLADSQTADWGVGPDATPEGYYSDPGDDGWTSSDIASDDTDYGQADDFEEYEY